VVDFFVSSDGIDPASGRTVVTSGGTTLVIIDEPYLLKIGEPPVAGPGTTVTYTLRVVNPMDRPALQVRVEDVMPAALEVISARATSGAAIVQGQRIAFTQGRLEAGGRVTITVVTRVRQGDPGVSQIENRACLTSASNAAPSCAEMRFLRAGELPSTGQTPFYRHMLAGLVLTLTGAATLWLWTRRPSVR
jgi:uncharacterized repeat protein (TIGR01451 family)